MVKRGGQGLHPYERKGALVTASKGLASCSQSHKSGNLEEDRISKLPVKILVAILSLLTIKEAGRSSVLSHRWRNLWTFFTGKLEMGCKKRPEKRTMVVKSLKFFRRHLQYKHDRLDMLELDRAIIHFRYHDMLVFEGKVVRDVNTVLRSHQGLFLDELKIQFPYWDNFSSAVDNWVKFASERDVRSFDLNLKTRYELSREYKLRSTKRLFSSSNPSHRNFSSLTCLKLSHVNVSGKVLEHFLANCHSLKQLRVKDSDTLVLNVTGPSLKLESLEVTQCCMLRVLSISAENLVSLKYDGPSQPLVLNNVPRLSHMSIAGDVLSSLEDKSCKHFRSVQQLERLEMKMEFKACTIRPKFRLQFPQMHCLKQLELDIHYMFGKHLVFYASLIKAFPLLHRFAMRYKYMGTSSYPSDEEGEERSHRKKRLKKTDKMTAAVTGEFKHQSLKVVELAGFVGCETDLKLVLSLVAFADSLEKLVIELGKGHQDEFRSRARELESKLPSSLNLYVLEFRADQAK